MKEVAKLEIKDRTLTCSEVIKILQNICENIAISFIVIFAMHCRGIILFLEKIL